MVQATVNDQYNLTTATLASSLKDVCRNFHADKYLDVKALDFYDRSLHKLLTDIYVLPSPRMRRTGANACTYVQVLEGHSFLGSLSTLGADINACFGDVIEHATLRAVQQVVNSSRAGSNPRAGQVPKAPPPQLASMHDAAKLLPPERFSAALSKVRSHAAWLTPPLGAVHDMTRGASLSTYSS